MKKFTLATFICIIIISVFFHFKQYSEVVNQQITIDSLQIDTEILSEKVAVLNKLAKADELFINQQFSESISIYEKLYQLKQIDSLSLLNRFNVFGRLMSNSGDDKSVAQTLRSEISVLINRNNALKEELIAQKQFLSDSLSNYFKVQLQKEKTEFYRESNISKLEFYSLGGTKTVYYGEVENGMANGKGMAYYPSGNIYMGEWKNNLRHGKNSAYKWFTGEIYEGDYKNDKREGYGVYYFTNGDYYKGEWKNDLNHGSGTLYSGKNEIKLSGQWENGNFVSK